MGLFSPNPGEALLQIHGTIPQTIMHVAARRVGNQVKKVSSKTIIDVSVNAVWQVISDFGAAGQYLFGVVTCTSEGQGIGARRTLTSADGSAIIERLEAIDPVGHRLSYALLSDTPFRNCLTTMVVHNMGAARAGLEWSASFEADGLPVSEATALLAGALIANGQALKQFMETGRK